MPRSFYPSSVDPKIQWAKVSCCPACNDEFQRDEAHAKTMLAAAGLTVTDKRQEIWESVKRGFSNPICGNQDRIAIREKLVPFMHEGEQRYKVYPGKDERVIKIVKKIVRGLCVHRQVLPPPVSEDRVWADTFIHVIPPKFEEELRTIYDIPNVVSCRAELQMSDEFPETHSAWILQILQTRFIAIVNR